MQFEIVYNSLWEIINTLETPSDIQRRIRCLDIVLKDESNEISFWRKSEKHILGSVFRVMDAAPRLCVSVLWCLLRCVSVLCFCVVFFCCVPVLRCVFINLRYFCSNALAGLDICSRFEQQQLLFSLFILKRVKMMITKEQKENMSRNLKSFETIIFILTKNLWSDYH